MSLQAFASTPARLGKFKGEILAHAIAEEILGNQGRQVRFPKNNSDTYVARRFLPYGATASTASSQNQFFQNVTATDRGSTVIQAHQTQEGITPLPETITPFDVTVVLQQYSCLYGFTDKTFDLFEDDIPKQMSIQIGERVTFVNEMIIYGALKACTNTYYGGGGTTIATVAGTITLNMIRKIVRNLRANHAKPINRMLSAGVNFNTMAVPAGYLVYCHTDMGADIRNLPGFTPPERYASGKPMPHELGMCEEFRFIGHPDLPSLQDSGAAVGATGMYSTLGSSIDVYPVIIVAMDAWSQVAVRGKESLKPTYLPPGEVTKTDPFGQRGYAGTIWWKAIMLENQGWMAVAFLGVSNLP